MKTINRLPLYNNDGENVFRENLESELAVWLASLKVKNGV